MTTKLSKTQLETLRLLETPGYWLNWSNLRNWRKKYATGYLYYFKPNRHWPEYISVLGSTLGKLLDAGLIETGMPAMTKVPPFFQDKCWRVSAIGHAVLAQGDGHD